MFMPPEGNDPLSATDLFMLRRWIERVLLARISYFEPRKNFTVLGTLLRTFTWSLAYAGKDQDEFTDIVRRSKLRR